MPGLLSGLFDGSSEQSPAATVDEAQGGDAAIGETTIDGGGEPNLVPEDLQPEPVGILGDAPNEGAVG